VETARNLAHATEPIETEPIATVLIRTPRRGPVKTSRVRAVVGVAVVGAEAADVVAVTKDANVRCRAKRMVNTARTRVQPQGECLPAEKRTTVLNGH